MKSSVTLPESYEEILKVDLQKDKKLALLVNVLAIILAIPLFILGANLVPISRMFDLDSGTAAYFLRFAVLIVGMVLYMILHELVHGICMKHFCKTKVNYGFTGLYAYAGSEAFYDKISYIIIALAPVIVWGIVLLIINCFVSDVWFWSVYFIQICNISGAAGDFYVTYRFLQLPSDIFIQDTGVSMTIYSDSGRK